MASGDIYRLAVQGTGPQVQQLVCVFHYAEPAVVIGNPGFDLVDAWRDTAEADWANSFSSSCSITRYSVRGVTDPTFGYDLDLSTPVPGEQTGDAVPPQDAAVITWTTGLIGRSYRGRSYVWPMHEGSVSAGAINSGYATALGVFATSAMSVASALLSLNWTLQVWSPTLQIATPVVGYVVRPYLRSQRRRQPGVGA